MVKINSNILLIVSLLFAISIAIMFMYIVVLRKKLLETGENIIEQKEWFNEIITGIEDIVFAVDINNSIIFINKAGLEFFNFRIKSVHKKTLRDTVNIINEKIKDGFTFFDKDFYSCGEYNVNEDKIFSIVEKDNSERIMKKTCNTIYNGKTLMGNVIVLQDITQLEQANRLNDILIKVASQVINYKDLQGCLVYMKEQLKHIINMENLFIGIDNKKDETIDLIYFRMENEYKNKVDRCIIPKEEQSFSNYILEAGDSQLLKFDALVDMQPVEFKGLVCSCTPKVAVGIPLKVCNTVIGSMGICSYRNEKAYTVSDIKLLEYVANHISFIVERKNWEAKMNKMAYYDQLTGLPNRIMFYKKLEQELITSTFNHQPIAIFFLDLDGFKQINDNYGHDVGDKFLEEIANRLNANKKDNVVIARIGGDEFTMFMSKINMLSDVIEFANDIIDIFETTILIEHLELRTTTSIGISFYPEDGCNSIELLKKADEALYTAKEKGKNRYHIYDINVLDKLF